MFRRNLEENYGNKTTGEKGSKFVNEGFDAASMVEVRSEAETSVTSEVAWLKGQFLNARS